jgi:MoaA/NifB/PqqE/SkfB family radical SAM enzyme
MAEEQESLSEIEICKRETLKRNKPLVYEKVIRYAEKIRRGESIAILQLQYDYRCNFRCRHCCTGKMEKKARSFGLEDVRELARQAHEIGLAHITITGGEPLLFPDLDELVEAADPQRFYIAMDTNGWLLTDEKARHLKSIGVEKIHLSLDSVSPDVHDDFRRQPGSHGRALRAIDAARSAGLALLLNTVVTKQRLHSQEFIEFLEFTKRLDVGVVLMLAKPAGLWEGNFDVILTPEDLVYVRELEKRYHAFTHLVPAYGLDLGCIAVKRMVSLTKYGDLMPCPWIHASLGNFFEEPLKDILARGMKIRFFGKRMETCLGSVDGEFMRDYIAKMEGKPSPVPYCEVFSEGDFLT